MWISLIFSMRSITCYKLYCFVNLVSFSIPLRPKMKDVDAISVWRLTSDYKTITAFLLRPLLIWILLFCPCLFSPSLSCDLSGLATFWMRSGDELHSSDDQPSWFWLYWVISLSLLSDDLINAISILYTFMLRWMISIHYMCLLTSYATFSARYCRRLKILVARFTAPARIPPCSARLC